MRSPPDQPPRTLAAAAALAAILALPTPTAAVAPGEDRSWLDAVPVAAWNAPGRPVPPAPPPAGDPPTVNRCAAQLRNPASAAEEAVALAGWSLVAPTVRGDGVEVVLGASSVDGMCRPTGYQLLVFSRGRFAGTLSPRPMDSRTDGAADLPTVGAAGAVEAGFLRYAADDPLCCPSRISTVGYRVEQGAQGPVVVVGAVRTSAPAPAPGAAPATSPEAGCVASGGTVGSASCCRSVGDFPNSCQVGACGCAPASSHAVRTCRCPEGSCFDGASCVGRERAR
jgi:hypothetical protein